MIGRTNAGAGGGLSLKDALIHVDAPAEGFIIFSKNNIVTKKFGVGDGILNDKGTIEYYYPVKSNNFGEWNVIWQKEEGTNTDIKTLQIIGKQQYDIYFGDLVLYDRTVQPFSDVALLFNKIGSNSISYTDVANNYIQLTSGSGNGYLIFKEQINFAPFKRLTSQGFNGQCTNDFGISSTLDTINAVVYKQYSSEGLYTLDITNVNIEGYVYVHVAAPSTSCNVKFQSLKLYVD